MSDYQRELQKEIHEWGEVERDLAQTADIAPYGGWAYRFFKWCERKCREERELLRKELAEARKQETTSHGDN